MSRIVTILFDSRPEAEGARERLARELRATSTRIVGKDTLAAIDGLKIGKSEAIALRQAVRRGATVVIAEVPAGTTAERITSLLGLGAGTEESGEEPHDSEPVHYGIHGLDEPLSTTAEPAEPAAPESAEATQDDRPRPRSLSGIAQRHVEIAEASVIPEKPVERREARNGYSSFSEAEAEAAGLFKERTIDFTEMREEAIVTKEAIVREEVIVTKTVRERTETIRDTVRNTEFDVEALESATAGEPDRQRPWTSQGQ